jgi:hypothetical protein
LLELDADLRAEDTAEIRYAERGIEPPGGDDDAGEQNGHDAARCQRSEPDSPLVFDDRPRPGEVFASCRQDASRRGYLLADLARCPA